MRSFKQQSGWVLVACFMSCFLPLWAAENSTNEAAALAAAKTSDASQSHSEIEQLKLMLLDQQRQINELREALAQQKKETDDSVSASAAPMPPTTPAPMSTFPSLGQVASTTGVVPSGQATGSIPLISTLVQAQPASPAVNVNDL